MKREWSEKEDSQLREFWKDNKNTLSSIAKELDRTRNSIAGRVHRLRLDKRDAPNFARKKPIPPPRADKRITVRVKSKKFTVEACKEMAVENEAPKERPEGLVTIQNLAANDCRWPMLGEGIGTLFCAETRAEGRSYCPKHCKKSKRGSGE